MLRIVLIFVLENPRRTSSSAIPVPITAIIDIEPRIKTTRENLILPSVECPNRQTHHDRRTNCLLSREYFFRPNQQHHTVGAGVDGQTDWYSRQICVEGRRSTSSNLRFLSFSREREISWIWWSCCRKWDIIIDRLLRNEHELPPHIRITTRHHH